MGENDFQPLVTGTTNTETLDIEGLLKMLDRKIYYIPDYQRDASQWDNPKKSLFIESIINNFTVPPLIVCPDYKEGEKFELVDGQQRLTTLSDFKNNEFSLCNEDELEYVDNLRELIQGKKFKELPDYLQDRLLYYRINIIKLPQNLADKLDLKLEIFRRINETGVPLSGQDLRLATFFDSSRVTFIRLAGIYDPERKGTKRMIESAKEKFDIVYPWAKSDHQSVWNTWWKDSTFAIGQSPSEMFLYFVIAKDIDAISLILNSKDSQRELKISYNRTINSVLDIYCARLQVEDRDHIKIKTLATLNQLHDWFSMFNEWFFNIKTKNVAQIKPASRVKISLFIAAASELWENPEAVTPSQWDDIQVLLLHGPSKIKEHLDFIYPTPRAKWPGQADQIKATYALCKLIHDKK